jgi:hypothetical protein
MQPNRDVRKGDDDGAPCGDQDFECWKDWGMKNPDKLPCKIDGSDDECWEKELRENPPCDNDDDDCWEHFKEVFDDKKDDRKDRRDDRRDDRKDRKDDRKGRKDGRRDGGEKPEGCGE